MLFDSESFSSEFLKEYPCVLIFSTNVYVKFVLGATMFQISQIISHADEVDKFLIFHVIVIMTIFIYMSLSNYIGQEITDVNNEIFIIALVKVLYMIQT